MSAPAAQPSAPVVFRMPSGAGAREPPERDGRGRDDVRLLVAGPGGLAHRPFADLPQLLDEGDLLVVNTSATLPAALDGARADASPAIVHVSGPLDGGDWAVEVRRADGLGADPAVRPGERIALPGGVALRLLAPHPRADAPRRLWRARACPAPPLTAYLTSHGRPIRYAYGARDVTLDELQNVYAGEPGSAEMASAGRPLTDRALVLLMARGVAVAPIVLHAGVSSPELHEPPAPERFRVPAATARLVRATRRGGGRVVAVGTTVVRALESAVDAGGRPVGAHGWTDLVLGPDRRARLVDGLLTGLHPPEASHLLLLEAVAGRAAVETAYAEAVRTGMRWHEFGDAMLFLPQAEADSGVSTPPGASRRAPRPASPATTRGEAPSLRGGFTEEPGERVREAPLRPVVLSAGDIGATAHRATDAGQHARPALAAARKATATSRTLVPRVPTSGGR